MPSPPAATPDKGSEPANSDGKQLTGAVGRAVLTALGRPANFLRVSVRQITGDGFRVNVLVGPDAASARIAHSFFVTADSEGKVVASSPAIAKLSPGER